MIPYGKQDISSEDIKKVIEVLKSDYLTQGPVVPEFEKIVANYCGSKYSIAVNSATSALHIACKALGVGKGDIVWTSANTFVASANCALYCGAEVDFVDINTDTFNISISKLSSKLEMAKKLNKLPKVLIPVHLGGHSCDMASISKLGKEYGFKIIEDASHAIGGAYKEKKVGACLYSDITIFSFHPVKIITTGEGGMALTNKAELAKKMKLFSSHGVTRDLENMEIEKLPGYWYYEQIELGFNYRMTDIQAALGISQMENIDNFIIQRNKIASYYETHINDLPLESQTLDKNIYSSFHLYIVRLDLKNIDRDYNQVFNDLREKGIGVNLHYLPVYLHPFYQKLGFSRGYCPEAERYSEECLSLPMYPSLKRTEQNKVLDTLRSVLQK